MRLSILSLAFAFSSNAIANLGFTNLTEAQSKDITRDLAANFSHRSVTGASSLGSLFGFEAVLVAGSTGSARLSDLSTAAGGGELRNIATVGALVGISIPFGFTFEYLALPSVNTNGANFSGNSLGVKWLMNEVIPVLPVNLALRLNNSSSEFGFSQNLGGGFSGDFRNETKVQEISLYFSPKLPVVEPYVGLGLVSATGAMTFSGSSSMFGLSNSRSVAISGTKMVAGLSIQLPLFSLGVEYQSLFGTSGYGGKLGISF